jgi:2',3'-cyclic-nucleotide 2'-phosphodiesterase (5'-nucleotidase family)
MKKSSAPRIFTILHTNDMHSSLIGMGPAADYTPFSLNDDATRGGFARLAGLIAQRKKARKSQGAVLVLDAGDYSMGTPFGAASREIAAELQLMFLMGFDGTTFGNHEFDLGPDGLGQEIGVAAKAGRKQSLPLTHGLRQNLCLILRRCPAPSVCILNCLGRRSFPTARKSGPIL